MNEDELLGRKIAKLILGFAHIFLKIWTVLLLYRWFVVPLGGMALSYWQVGGLLLFLSALRPSRDPEEKASGRRVVLNITVMLLLLLTGLGVKCLI